MSNVRKTIVSNCEKKFLTKCLSEFIRIDGRAFDEFRKINIEFGKDWGCCYVSIGKTRVIAQVSCEIQQPKSSRPSEGILNINIELNPISAPHFEANRQSDQSVQLNRLIEKCIKDSKAVDLESLCIKMNEKVWAFRVDVNVLNHEGNILDCASIAALTALSHFRRPDVTCDGEEFIIHSYKQRDPIPTVIHHYPVCITYSIFSGGDFIVADPSLLEEGVADAFLTVGLNAYKELCGLHLGGKSELLPNLILETTNKAANHAVRIVQTIKEVIEKDVALRQERRNVGFHQTKNREILQDDAMSKLTMCLDNFTTKVKKKKNKKEKEEKMDVDASKKEKGKSTNVENLGKGSAALIIDNEASADKNGADKWNVETDEEDEVIVVDVPEKKVVTVDIADSDGSEEETVIVINADKKTNKKRKK